MTTTVPKKRLVQEILVIVPDDDIRSFFHIAETTELQGRLLSLPKFELEQLLLSNPERARRLETLEEHYPFGAAGAFYIPKVERHRYTVELLPLIASLAEAGRSQALFPDGSVRAVYVDRLPEVAPDLGLIEIPLTYERKLEYRIGDPPNADNYGDVLVTYSLERAFIWLMDNYAHGVICCTGLAAVRAILQFGEFRVGLNWMLPNMTTEMFERLKEESDPSSATFSGYFPGVPTITIHDPLLAETEEFRELETDPNRLQTAGFGRGVDGFPFASFGIARRYARIWTPWQHSKQYLATSMRGIINRTEEELAAEYETNLQGYVAYFGNASVTIEGTLLRGKDRRVFQRLMEAIVAASKHSSKEVVIEPSLLGELIERKSLFSIQALSVFSCQNCGGGVGFCPDCLLPYDVQFENGEFRLICPNCNTRVEASEGYKCECGTINEIVDIPQHIQLLPDVPILDAVSSYVDLMDEVQWRGVFLLDGLVLRLIDAPTPVPDSIPNQIRLVDLQNWRTVAHLHQISSDQALLPILRFTKEKCRRGGTPPDSERCQSCKGSAIAEWQIWEKNEMCLPRIMGLAINHRFDGIHHGHEIADVRYSDVLTGVNKPVSIGIHLKSRYRPKPQGQGRGTRPVKELFAQVFFSAYQALERDDVNFNVIGISMPNKIKENVVASLRSLLNRLGFSLLVVDEDDWLRIVKTVIEQLAFERAIE